MSDRVALLVAPTFSVLLDRDWTNLNEGAFVIAIGPMPPVTVPIAFLVMTPICVIPNMVSSVLIRDDRQRRADYRARSDHKQ